MRTRNRLRSDRTKNVRGTDRQQLTNTGSESKDGENALGWNPAPVSEAGRTQFEGGGSGSEKFSARRQALRARLFAGVVTVPRSPDRSCFKSFWKAQNLVSINIPDVIKSLRGSSSCTGGGMSNWSKVVMSIFAMLRQGKKILCNAREMLCDCFRTSHH